MWGWEASNHISFFTGGFYSSAHGKHWDISNHISIGHKRWEWKIYECLKLCAETFPGFTTREFCSSTSHRFKVDVFLYLQQDVWPQLCVDVVYHQVWTWRCWVGGRCGRLAWTTATARVTVLETTLEFTSVWSLFFLIKPGIQWCLNTLRINRTEIVKPEKYTQKVTLRPTTYLFLFAVELDWVVYIL